MAALMVHDRPGVASMLSGEASRVMAVVRADTVLSPLSPPPEPQDTVMTVKRRMASKRTDFANPDLDILKPPPWVSSG